MDLLENMNAAIDYVENHLEEEIEYQEIAKIACFPSIILSECFRL